MAPRLIPVDYDPFDYAGMLAASAAADTAYRGGYADWLRPGHTAENVPSQWEMGRQVAAGDVFPPQGSAVGPYGSLLAMARAGTDIGDMPRQFGAGAVGALAHHMADYRPPLDEMTGVYDPETRQMQVDALRKIEAGVPEPTGAIGRYTRSIGGALGSPVTYAGVNPLVGALWGIGSGVGAETLGHAYKGTPYEGAARFVGGWTPMVLERAAMGPLVRAMPEGAAGAFGGRLPQPPPEALRGPTKLTVNPERGGYPVEREPSLADIFAPAEGIDVYHSTPHTFKPLPGKPFGQFDPAKMGTGEGAQVITPGTYFAESPAVSGQGGHYWNELLDQHFKGPEALAANRLKAEGFDRDKAIAAAQRDVADWQNKIRDVSWSAQPDRAEQLEYAEKMLGVRGRELKMLQSGDPVGPRTIEARINARPEQLLDWERVIPPKSPVSDLVASSIAFPSKRATEKYGAPPDYMMKILEEASLGFRPQVSGQQAFNMIARGQGSRMDATRALSEAGVPGVKYLDQLSRPGATSLQTPAERLALDVWNGDRAQAIANIRTNYRGKTAQDAIALLEGGYNPLTTPSRQTSNYIVFPGQEHLIDILKRYGVAGLSMLPPAIAAQYQQRLQPVDHDPFSPTSQ